MLIHEFYELLKDKETCRRNAVLHILGNEFSRRPCGLSIKNPASTLPSYEVLSAKETDELNHNWPQFKVADRHAHFDTVPGTIAVHDNI